MTLARTGTITGQALCRRASGSCARTLAALTKDHRSAFRRLSALRQQFVWEQQWELKNKQAAQSTADPCLKELYLELAQEGALHAGCIRSLLEQMA